MDTISSSITVGMLKLWYIRTVEYNAAFKKNEVNLNVLYNLTYKKAVCAYEFYAQKTSGRIHIAHAQLWKRRAVGPLPKQADLSSSLGRLAARGTRLFTWNPLATPETSKISFPWLITQGGGLGKDRVVQSAHFLEASSHILWGDSVALLSPFQLQNQRSLLSSLSTLSASPFQHLTQYCPYVYTFFLHWERTLRAKTTTYLFLSLAFRVLHMAGGWHAGLFVPWMD